MIEPRPAAETIEFSLLRVGREVSIDRRLELGTEVSRAGATPEMDVAPVVAAVMLRVLRLEEERWRRAAVGTIIWWSEKRSEVEEVVEATLAV